MTNKNTSPDASDSATSESPAYKQARERAEMLQGLYIHLLVFAVMNAGLVGINWALRGEDGGWWVQWPLAIWGIGLLVHILVTVAPVFSSDWVDRRTQRILTKQGH